MGTNPQYAVGDVIANKYIVERPLSSSLTGPVYLANENFNTQKLVVKFYRPDVSAYLLAAPDFFLKAATMTELENDNLCGTLDIQAEMGLAFVARVFAEGYSFEEWLHRTSGEANYFSRGLEILWQACQGLMVLHERTRHLNIHPGNIIVGSMGAKLCDWDPRALSSIEMTTEALPLRPEYQGYRAPEISNNGSFLSYPSTDLFAIAGLLFRLIKGTHPSSNLQHTLQDIRSFDRDISTFLIKAMHPKPEERFQEAGSFADALWDLKPAMERQGGKKANPPEFFAEKEPTLAGESLPAEEDFFSSFKSSGDTLFGEPPPTAKPKPTNPSPQPYIPPSYSAPVQNHSAPPRSELESLESSGTLFGTSGALFSSTPSPAAKETPVRPDFRSEIRPEAPSPKPRPKIETAKPQPIKPLAVSLSSLEKDPLDRSGDSTAGFTQFGFKGAGENRTGIFTPEQKSLSAKTKLYIILASVGGLILILGLGALFFILRGSAAPAVAPVESAPLTLDEEGPASIHQDPTPEPEPAYKQTEPELPKPAPQPTAVKPSAQSSAQSLSQSDEPPQPKIEAPVPEGIPKSMGEKPVLPTMKPEGNGKISSRRITELMEMIETRAWPEKASLRLQAANDFNDLGKTAEANMAYGKALAATDATEKQKISALGGLAITFQSMGMNDQAKDAIDRILQINPKNGFALKLRERL